MPCTSSPHLGESAMSTWHSKRNSTDTPGFGSMSADAGWNAGGECPCDVLERIAQVEDPSARMWKESDIPTVEQGVRVLGTALGHIDFLGAQSRVLPTNPLGG